MVDVEIKYIRSEKVCEIVVRDANTCTAIKVDGVEGINVSEE